MSRYRTKETKKTVKTAFIKRNISSSWSRVEIQTEKHNG